MKKIFIFLSVIFLFGCKHGKHIPDVSNIHIQLTTERFEKDFFAVDTNNILSSLNQLQKKYPDFLTDYLFKILAVNPQPDSLSKYVRLFVRDYTSINNDVKKSFPSFSVYQQQIENAFQFIQYYFPKYPLPKKIITFTGPIEGISCALTANAVAIGLQSHLGENYSTYKTEYINEIYPAYKTRKFAPEYITVNCIKNIIDDMYPQNIAGKPLVEQMIDAGKRLYLLDAILPKTPDSIKTGYTQRQLEGCYKNEKYIWTYFINNNLLFEIDPSIISEYVNDGPNTPELGSEAPGFIGQFTGWQIVKKWMGKNENVSLDELMKTGNKKIYEEAKYKP
jgi:hypothetical protein